MKDFYAAIIFAVSLLAFTVVVLVFKYGQQRVYTRVLEAENEASQTRVSTIEMEAERRAVLAKQRAERNLVKARQAKEMLEKARAKNDMTQKQVIDAMNAQLEREAEARISAEKASVELIAQRDELAKAVGKTRKALEDLQGQKKSTSVTEIERMRKLLREREAEIERLKKRQAELEALRAIAFEAQKKTEEEIESRGGTVTLPWSRRVFSPNIRVGR